MKIEQVARSVLDVSTIGYEVYLAVSKHMDAIEIENGLSGTQKKTYVIDFIFKNFDLVKKDWTKWFTLLSKFIDAIKTLYNVVK